MEVVRPMPPSVMVLAASGRTQAGLTLRPIFHHEQLGRGEAVRVTQMETPCHLPHVACFPSSSRPRVKTAAAAASVSPTVTSVSYLLPK